MHPRLRLAAAAALVALTLAACGSSSGGSAAPSNTTASAAPGSPAASESASPAASDAASPAVSSAAPSASAGPSATPTPEEAALIALLPKTINGVTMTAKATTLSALAASSAGSQGFLDFVKSLGVTPENVLLAYVMPTTPLKTAMSAGAYRFIGVDVAKLPDAFTKASIATQPGLTVTQDQVGGRTVTALHAPASLKQPPVYVVFKGDTLFFGASGDAAMAAAIVQSFPK